MKTLNDFSLINLDKNGQVTISLNDLNKKVSGIGLLTQGVIKRILTLPGTDKYFPKIGSQLGNLFGAVTREEVEGAKSTLPIFVKSLQDSIKEEQELYPELSLHERLKSLEIVDLTYDESSLG
ncbi:hypothetical protein H8D85_02180 [bacterium]|nr:hypothetical protein [bacterium]